METASEFREVENQTLLPEEDGGQRDRIQGHRVGLESEELKEGEREEMEELKDTGVEGLGLVEKCKAGCEMKEVKKEQDDSDEDQNDWDEEQEWNEEEEELDEDQGEWDEEEEEIEEHDLVSDEDETTEKMEGGEKVEDAKKMDEKRENEIEVIDLEELESEKNETPCMVVDVEDENEKDVGGEDANEADDEYEGENEEHEDDDEGSEMEVEEWSTGEGEVTEPVQSAEMEHEGLTPAIQPRTVNSSGDLEIYQEQQQPAPIVYPPPPSFFIRTGIAVIPVGIPVVILQYATATPVPPVPEQTLVKDGIDAEMLWNSAEDAGINFTDESNSLPFPGNLDDFQSGFSLSEFPTRPTTYQSELSDYPPDDFVDPLDDDISLYLDSAFNLDRP